jgi:hypothetical protein
MWKGQVSTNQKEKGRKRCEILEAGKVRLDPFWISGGYAF